jgi:hypothetical protein
VFFLHITTGADNTNNVLALASVSDRHSCDGRIALDHGEPQPQHDADGSDHADAAVAISLGRVHERSFPGCGKAGPIAAIQIKRFSI